MDAILFFHRASVMRTRLAARMMLLDVLNPSVDLMPLAGNDEMAYQWFDSANPKHDRFFLISSDVVCSQPLRERFGDEYHRKFAHHGRVVRPWSNEPFDGTPDRDWEQFEDSDTAELYPYLRGIVPVTVVMLSHDAIFNFTQLYKSIPAFKAMRPELRLGTLACMAGYLGNAD